MPSFQRRKNGVYYFIVKIDGRQRWISLRTKIKKIGRERYAEMADRYDRGILDLDPNQPIPTLQQIFDDYLPFSKGHRSPRTYRDAESHIRLFLSPYFGHLRAVDLTAKHIEEFQGLLLNFRDPATGDTSPYHPRTINHIQETLRKILRRAVEHKDIREMPCKITMLKVPDSLPRYATTDHVRDWMGYLDAGPRLRAVLTLMTGITDRDLGYVLKSGYDRENATVRFRRPKTTTDIVIPLTPTGIQILDHLVKEIPGPELFPARSSRKAFYTASKKLQKSGGRNLTPHMLRHSFATWLLSIGVPPAHLQQILGHKTLQTTLRYAKVMPEHLRESIAKIDTPKFDIRALLTIPRHPDGRSNGRRWTDEEKKAQAERMKGNKIGKKKLGSKRLAGDKNQLKDHS